MEEIDTNYLAKAQKEVKKFCYHYKNAKDKDDLDEVLTNAASMIYELGKPDSAQLTPKQYYGLFMDVTNNLHDLDSYFTRLNRAGMPMEELYRRVQETQYVLPRLYLLAIAGAVYIQSKEAAAKDILKDLVEMAKGVQYPMRALFLRNFIHQQTKKLLPDVDNEYFGSGGTVEDSIDFVLQNFTQMNKLWVRMQYMRRRRGRNLTERQKEDRAQRKKKMEAQRKDLKLLVGLNLQRLSSLEGVDVEVYSEKVLPNILEQVANCRDTIAQEYLMDLIIQAFPCEFHVRTLDAYLGTCSELREQVDVSKILQSFMNRLGDYAENNAIPPDAEIFKTFDNNVAKVIDSTEMPLKVILGLKDAQMRFALRCAQNRTEQLVYAGHILGFLAELMKSNFGASGGSATQKLAEAEGTLTTQILESSIEQLNFDVLNPELAHFGQIISYLPWAQRKQVGVTLLRAVIGEQEAVITSPALLQTLLGYVKPLVKDDDDAPGDHYSAMGAVFVREQLMMAKLIQKLDSENLAELFKMYQLARQQFGHGGTNRIKYTLLPLVFAVLRLINRVVEAPDCGVKLKRLFQFVHETVTALASNHANVSLRLFLQTSLAADRLALAGHKGFTAIAYEFLVQSFILYEEMANSKQQRAAINEIIGALYQCRTFDAEEVENLVTKVTQYAAKLIKKPDQCRMVQLCCQLFWTANPDYKKKYEDQRRVLECLQRCLKIADVCMSDHTQLFVEVLNSYLYFFEAGCPTITPKYITGLIALIDANQDSSTPSDEKALAAKKRTEQFFNNTTKHIRFLKEDEKFAEKLAKVKV